MTTLFRIPPAIVLWLRHCTSLALSDIPVDSPRFSLPIGAVSGAHFRSACDHRVTTGGTERDIGGRRVHGAAPIPAPATAPAAQPPLPSPCRDAPTSPLQPPGGRGAALRLGRRSPMAAQVSREVSGWPCGSVHRRALSVALPRTAANAFTTRPIATLQPHQPTLSGLKPLRRPRLSIVCGELIYRTCRISSRFTTVPRPSGKARVSAT